MKKQGRGRKRKGEETEQNGRRKGGGKKGREGRRVNRREKEKG